MLKFKYKMQNLQTHTCLLSTCYRLLWKQKIKMENCEVNSGGSKKEAKGLKPPLMKATCHKTKW